MAAVTTPNGFELDDSGKRVVVDPICRIEGHLRIEVNLDENNVIRNAVSTGNMWRGLEVILKGRDPRSRAGMLRRGGGTSLTEAAVARGLKFLARHQSSDGSWSLHKFNHTAHCDDTCTGNGSTHSPAGTDRRADAGVAPSGGDHRPHRSGPEGARRDSAGGPGCRSCRR